VIVKSFPVLLVNLPVYVGNKEYKLPSSLLYLASYAQNAGKEIHFLDLNTFKPWEDGTEYPGDLCYPVLEDYITTVKPKLIGFSCIISGMFGAAWELSKLVKANFPGIKIVIGGMHPTVFARDILENCPEIDYVVLGEGEVQFVDLINALSGDEYQIKEITNGFGYRNGTGLDVIVHPQTTFIQDLDTVPFPAYNLVDFKRYEVDTSHWVNPKKLNFSVSVPFIASRSCPMQCPFCAMFLVMGKGIRYRSAKNVVDEIEYLYREHGMVHFNFYDDNLTFKKKWAIDICNDIVKRGLNIQFETLGSLMINKIDQEVVDALASAGLVRAGIAPESGSDYIRNKIMGKLASDEKIYEVVAAIRKYPHIFIRAEFIMGMPEDTPETLMATYDMVEKLDVDEVFTVNVIPFPGTKLYSQCVQDNLFIDVDTKNLWRESSLYAHKSIGDRFFVKPYSMTLDELRYFRRIFDEQERIKNNPYKYQQRQQLGNE
jgi:anaerobic magnesium-protoporphyrin IX monomethyl ester cyclase